MKTSLLAVFLLSLVVQNHGQNRQTDRFIVGVAHFDLPNVNTAIDRCSGTILSETHVLAAASCVTPIGQGRGIVVRYLIENVVLFHRTRRISIHPSYRTSHNNRANIALIMVETMFTTQLIPLLPIANLPSNSTCTLFGWGQVTANPRSEVVSIFNAEFCDPESPQISCSTFDSLEDETCSAVLGSPVMCDGNTRLTGFMTSDGCLSDGTRNKINYHSLNSFRNWFEEVIRADSFTRQSSENFVVQVMEYSPQAGGWDRLRCVGTLINRNHLLTTATCVLLPENSQFAIGVRANWERFGWRTESPREIFVHPDFQPPNTANIAVIRFDLEILRFTLEPLMTLGSLPTNNATDGHICQLVGWGDTRGRSRHDVVSVYRPQLCRENLPQVFCSFIDIGSQETCSAVQGSPVICGGNIAGVSLSNRICGQIGGINTLDFHSVGEFREWIDEVSGAGKLAAASKIFILSALLMITKNFL